MSLKNFPTCHCHPFSLDSGSTPAAMVAREVQLETGSVVATDHGTLACAPELYRLAKKAGIIPILGEELYFRDDNCSIIQGSGIKKTEEGKLDNYLKYMHLTCHALDQEAFETLGRLSSLADARSERHGSEKKPLFDWAMLEELCSHNVTVGTGCLIGMVQRHLMVGRPDLAVKYFEKLLGIVKPGNLFVEMFPHVCDRNWVQGVFFTVEGQEKPLKFWEGKKLRVSFGDEVVEDGAKEIAKRFERGVTSVVKLLAQKDYTKWVECDKIILNARAVEDFIINECVPSAPEGDIQLRGNKFMLYLASKYKLPVQISDDSHFATADEKVVQDVRLLGGGGGSAWRFHTSYHRQSSDEAFAYFGSHMGVDLKTFESWVQNSKDWASRFGWEWVTRKQLPTKFYPENTLKHMKVLIDQVGRMDWNNKQWFERLQAEVKMLNHNGVIDLLPYFFLAQDGIQHYEKNGLLTGPGRGCLTENALVFTENGYQSIKDVTIGTKVYSHTGKLQTVTNVFKYQVEEDGVSLVTTKRYSPFSLTKDHKVLAFRRTRLPTIFKGKERVWKKETPIPEWVAAGDLKVGDLLFTPKITRSISTPKLIDLATFCGEDVIVKESTIEHRVFSDDHLGTRSLGLSRPFLRKVLNGYVVTDKTKNGRTNTRALKAWGKFISILEKRDLSVEQWKKCEIKSTPRFLEIDEDLAYFIGRWVGDGWIHENQSVGVAFNSDDDAGIQKIESILGKFCVSSPTHVRHKTKKLVQSMYRSSILCRFLRATFPDYKNTSGSKYIPESFFGWPDNLLIKLMEGYIDSDGSEEKSDRNNRTSIDTTSKRLCEGTRCILTLLGVPSSVGLQKSRMRGPYMCAPAYKTRFHWSDKSESGTWSELTGSMPCRLQNVYDLEVSEDHSFLTSEYAVHNSAAGMLLCYLLGITHVEPQKFGLSKERFLTETRIKSGKLPDIDIDHPSRDLLIDPSVPGKGWLYDRFPGHFAQISTDTMLRLRSSIKDVCRMTLGKVTPEIESLTKKLPVPPTGVTDKDFVFGYIGPDGDPVKGIIETDETLKFYISQYPTQWAIVQKCLGVCRSRGRHASAFVITNEPVINFLPTMTLGDDALPITQYTMNNVEQVGGIKMDYLIVSSLNDIQAAIKLIQGNAHYTPKDEKVDGKRVPGIRIVPHNGKVHDIWDLPEDPDVFLDICAGKSETVFQFNTDSARRWLKKFYVENVPTLNTIEDIAAFTALDRPGPLDATVEANGTKRNMLEEFAARARGEEAIGENEHLNKIIPETHGVLVYQEQVQKVFQIIGKTTPEQADEFRVHVGKKKMAEVAKDRNIFMPGATATLGSEEEAKRIWDTLSTFAQYGFNKSVDGEVILATATGETKRLADFRPGDKVLSVDENGCEIVSDVVQLHDHGLIDGVEVEFDDGYKMVCSLEHKFLTAKGMMTLRDIVETGEEVLACKKK